ncbi:MAG TPA: hypothetical protein VFK52_12545 [Nocardioidaceae bacterium]|nr:hypothetical protein [Nocardioidaceae bacterium]
MKALTTHPRRAASVLLALVGALTLVLGMTVLTAGGASAAPDPNGNNGTVKVAGLGDIDLIPDNEPHLPCTLTVQWYDFDEGADIISTVGFALQPPTAEPDYTMSVDGPGEVFVGEDAASGTGNDFDGEAVYTLSFTGDPHPQQGYHVKLTIHTPDSFGADTKHKVFWVEPCETPTVTETPTETETPTVTETPTETETPTVTETPTGTETPTVTVSPTETETTGTETSTVTVLPSETETSPGGGSPSVTVLPTEIDAGLQGGSSSHARGLVLVGAGLLLLAMSLGLLTGSRPRGMHQV